MSYIQISKCQVVILKSNKGLLGMWSVLVVEPPSEWILTEQSSGWQGQCLLVEVLEAASRGEDLSRALQTLSPILFLLPLALPFGDCCFFAKERDVRNSLVVQCLGLCFH